MEATRIDVRNPRTGENDYHFTQVGDAELARTVAFVREAQKAWRAAGVTHRCQVLRAFRDNVAKRRTDIVAALSVDTGRYIESELEVDVVTSALDRWCDEAPTLLAENDPKQSSIPFLEISKQRVPYPLVGAITPWNFPVVLSTIDAIPALAAGSAVIVKPSELTPRFVAPLQEAIDATNELADVFKFLPGNGQLGAKLIDHVDQICFTGSVATGRNVGEAAARNFIPAQLELGGKDPAIVTASADLGRAAAAISWGGLANAGQSCLSIERIYVEASAYEPFVEHLTACVNELKLNVADIKTGEIGPVISANQVTIIETHIRDALEQGARAVCGGEIEDHGGLWCQPTVLADANESMRIMHEETFGPVLPVASFDSEDEVVSRANGTDYGLSAAVFSGEPAQAARIARQLDAGAISINDAALTGVMHEGEKQAFKLSGLVGRGWAPHRLSASSAARPYCKIARSRGIHGGLNKRD